MPDGSMVSKRPRVSEASEKPVEVPTPNISIQAQCARRSMLHRMRHNGRAN